MELCWIVYWINKNKGVGPLGLIACFDTEFKAYDFIHKTFSFNDWEKVGVTSVPKR